MTAVNFGIGDPWARGILQRSFQILEDSAGERVLLDADYESKRFFYNGSVYGSETALNTAAGGTQSDSTRVFGPYADPTGTDLLPDTAAANWSLHSGMTATDEAGGVKFTSGGNLSAASLQISTAALAGLFTGNANRPSGAGPVVPLGTGHDNNFGDPTSTTTIGTSDAPFSLLVGGGASLWVGFRNGSSAGTGDTHVSNLKFVEAWPLQGWQHGAFAAYIDFTTPASVASTEVIFFASGTDLRNDRARMRVELSTSFALTLTWAVNSAVSATLSLGTLAASTRYRVALSGANANYAASLNGANVVTATSGTFPGLAKLYLGRSFAGETFTGTLNRVSIAVAAQEAPWLEYQASGQTALWTEGDSYMATVGGGNLGDMIETAAGRPVSDTAVGGASMDDIKARVLARSYLKNQTFVIWDGSPNSYGTPSAYCDLLQDIFDFLGHERFVLITTGVPYGTDPTSTLDIWAEMESRWPDNILDWRDYIPNTGNAMNADQMFDSVHPTTAARALVAGGVQDFIAAKGW